MTTKAVSVHWREKQAAGRAPRMEWAVKLWSVWQQSFLSLIAEESEPYMGQ